MESFTARCLLSRAMEAGCMPGLFRFFPCPRSFSPMVLFPGVIPVRIKDTSQRLP